MALSASVGRWDHGATNAPGDVRLIQQLLSSAANRLNALELNPGAIDGVISRPPAASATVNAIEALQARFTTAIDGIIGVGSASYDALVHAASDPPPPPAPIANETGCCFPFPTVPHFSWEQRPRAFASPRNGGARLHAGCDLYFPVGTPIHAVADGKVIRGPYPFYCETFALEIDHGSFVARYGEIQSTTEVHNGDSVSAGQRIAKVGHLVGIEVDSDMLHFELYAKTSAGPLTVAVDSASASRNGVSFMRRKDLLDPTSRLDQWQTNLPAAGP